MVIVLGLMKWCVIFLMICIPKEILFHVQRLLKYNKILLQILSRTGRLLASTNEVIWQNVANDLEKLPQTYTQNVVVINHGISRLYVRTILKNEKYHQELLYNDR